MKQNNIYNEKYLEYQKDRCYFRKWIRKMTFLKHIKSYVIGNAIDFGCGSGELLSLLNTKSRGYDINISSVNYCKNTLKLDAMYYDPDSNNILDSVAIDQFDTFLMVHVLEHLLEPRIFLQKLMMECSSKNIKRLIFVVPCKKGFYSHKEHVHYIDLDFFLHFDHYADYAINKIKYFPFNSSTAGNWFYYNELIVVFDRKSLEFLMQKTSI